jgi:dCMP deaminase
VRPAKETTWLEVCQVIAKQSTCLRRSVGCVLVDSRGHVLSTGYNGVAPGRVHCNEELIVFDGNLLARAGAVPRGIKTRAEHPNACKGAGSKPGEGLDLCEAIHAEQNALLQCRDPQAIDTCYVTHSPCVHCAKLLCCTSCRCVVFLEEYAHGAAARDLFIGGSKGDKIWLKWLLK